jgi:hypothetical protein
VVASSRGSRARASSAGQRSGPTATQRFCSHRCWTRAPHDSYGKPQPQRRKVERPPYEQLLAEVRELGFSAAGRKYGVSDNAIRKWIRQYDRERGAQRAASSRSGLASAP